MDDENSVDQIDKLSNLQIDRRNVLKSGAAIAGATAFVGPLNSVAADRLPDLPALGHIPKSPNPAHGKTGKDAIEPWVDYFQPSTMTRAEQRRELEFIVEASEPFRGMSINAICEATAAQKFEANVLTRAFKDLTGITVDQQLMAEGKIVSNFLTEVQTQTAIYDIFTLDSDFIGTLPRIDVTHPIDDYIEGDGKHITLPTLDLDDFIGKDWVTWPGDGKMYQLPLSQFANLLWYRKDWFERPDLRKKFKAEYGYELDVPVNWSAYEDIADFFTNKVKYLEVEGRGRTRIYGHMDYGRKGPSIGWRIHDSWLSMAGMSSTGVPFGRPVNDWGIRVNEDLQPLGSTVERGGAVNGPAAVYAIDKYVNWLRKYAPPEASSMTFYTAGPIPAKGYVAQQIFWYTAFTASMMDPSLPVVNDDGTPKWRMAPSPHGPYWESGMKIGYQDMGSWTLPKYTPKKKMQAAWLYAQFTDCKTVSLRKVIAGLMPFRKSDVDSEAMTKAAPYLGGLVEFYRSPAVKYWTPTGPGVPHYAKLTPAWWKNIAPVVTGAVTSQQAMDNLGESMDSIMYRLTRAGVFEQAAPNLNPKKSREYWLSKPGSPKQKLENEEPPGQTKPYDELLKAFNNPSSLTV